MFRAALNPFLFVLHDVSSVILLTSFCSAGA